MIKRTKGHIEIYCDMNDCDSNDELFIDSIIDFKEAVKEEGWHLLRHSRCICMDCWDAGKR